jgi:biopolymer transport protein ExbD
VSRRKLHGHKKMLSVKPATVPNSEINVTPLVDVVLVLLIIFMVVTPLLEKDITVRVPTTEKVEEMNEVPPDQLVVRVEDSGGLTINNDKVPEAEYVDRLKALLAPKADADKVVFFVAADAANYGKLVAALDGAKAAGAKTLGMATEVAEAAPAPAPAPAPPP